MSISEATIEFPTILVLLNSILGLLWNLRFHSFYLPVLPWITGPASGDSSEAIKKKYIYIYITKTLGCLSACLTTAKRLEAKCHTTSSWNQVLVCGVIVPLGYICSF